MAIMSGLSANEMYCMHRKGLSPGELVIGNSVFSLGVLGGIGSGLRTLAGGEVVEVTSIIHEGRQNSYSRMVGEAEQHGGVGITGVSSELVQHSGNIEFLSVGSCVHEEGAKAERLQFSSSADGQELYCLLDSGFRAHKFVFGNVAYSIGVGGGIMGALKSMARGEIHEFSSMFNTTRHLALQRITAEARHAGANAVVGIETSIIPFGGMQEMVMVGTAASHPALPAQFTQEPVTSDVTCEEMWNLASLGYMPIRLVLGVSIYSIGLMGGLTAAFKQLGRGEISEMTSLIYEARENALDKIRKDAEDAGADDVVGIKTYVYELGSGIIEFMAMGTAVKRIPGISTVTDQLIPQAIIRDRDTFYNSAEMSIGTDLNKAGR